MATPIILDCDPGHDDAVALLLAAGNDAIDLLAVTTVAGNCPLELATLNARRVAALAGPRRRPIAAGAAGPLQGELVTAPGHPRRDRPRRLRADHRRGAARPARRDRADGRHARRRRPSRSRSSRPGRSHNVAQLLSARPTCTSGSARSC
jgi:inosine-uridine nucleoside N-ribohydrolase